MIDLDALAAELRASGFVVARGPSSPIDPETLTCSGFQVRDGRLSEHARRSGVALDIIRRHVESRPADDLRERMLDALLSCQILPGKSCYGGVMIDVERAVNLLAVIGDAGAQGVGG